jgi:hypothetical protein
VSSVFDGFDQKDGHSRRVHTLKYFPCGASRSVPIHRDTRRPHSPVTERSRSACLPVTERSRSARLPVTERSRSARLPVTERSRSARLPVTERCTPVTERSRSVLFPLDPCCFFPKFLCMQNKYIIEESKDRQLFYSSKNIGKRV